MAWHSIV